MKAKIKLIEDPENPNAPPTLEVMAEAIVKISEAAKKLMNSGLSEKALIILLHHGIGASYISKRQIEYVLDALPDLKNWCVKKKS